MGDDETRSQILYRIQSRGLSFKRFGLLGDPVLSILLRASVCSPPVQKMANGQKIDLFFLLTRYSIGEA